MQEPSDQKIFELILELEDELLAEGFEPKERHFRLPVRAMEHLGYSSFVVSGRHVPEVLSRIREIHGKLYRTKNVAIGGSHGGAFMFRGIAGSIHVPWLFGTAHIYPFAHSDFSPQQVKWLQSDPDEAEAYISTFTILRTVFKQCYWRWLHSHKGPGTEGLNFSKLYPWAKCREIRSSRCWLKVWPLQTDHSRPWQGFIVLLTRFQFTQGESTR